MGTLIEMSRYKKKKTTAANDTKELTIDERLDRLTMNNRIEQLLIELKDLNSRSKDVDNSTKKY